MWLKAAIDLQQLLYGNVYKRKKDLAYTVSDRALKNNFIEFYELMSGLALEIGGKFWKMETVSSQLWPVTTLHMLDVLC